MKGGAELGRRLAERDLTAAPAALNLVENRSAAARPEIAALLGAVSPAALGGEAPAHIVGVTGPPGAGKSTLLSVLVAGWRGTGRSVAVLAVDPSSKRSGGALLGDRARIDADPADRGIFIRSMAAGERLGGLAPATRAAAQALAAAFDVVVIETVGVGQSETEIAEAADTVAVIVQPGSGDALQFLKAGIMEVPDALVVTKADLGTVATRAVRDLRAAMRSLGSRTPVLAVSSVHPVSGVGELIAALDAHREGLDLHATRLRTRRLGALADFVAEHGARGLRELGGRREAERFLAAAAAGGRRTRARGRARRTGVRIALDDFGTGYSSLSYLERFPIDELKLDRGFIARLASGDDDPVLVRAILDMAHALGMVVVAEGIETEEQASVLRELGCERAQGYALARPAAAEVILELVSPARAVPSSAPRR